MKVAEISIREKLPMPSLKDVLTHRPLGLVFDIDGTLSPIAPTPDTATLYPGIALLLEQARTHAYVAIMTGRAVTNGSAIVNVEGLTYIGSHGLEWSDGLPSSSTVQLVSEALPYIQPSKDLLALLERKLADVEGVIVEYKHVGGAVHYRLSPDPEKARQTILSLITEPTKQATMHLSEGKCVIEIQSPVAVNKGQALRRFVRQFNLSGVIFAGDDRTDLDAVLEIQALKQEGIAALSIAVQHADTLPALLELSDIQVEGVGGMAQLLRMIIDLLSAANSTL
jgi:trehalose 6-phosphate phosphatase